jgi:hypothetical protein
MKRTISAAAAAAAVTLALVGCQAQKSSNPLSPSVAGPIPGVEISSPTLLEPGQGFRFKADQPIRLVIQNATTNGVRPITYTFEVASDTNFETKVFARGGVSPGGDGRTSVQIDRLDLGRSYYWRARADDGANASLYSAAQFEVLPKPLLTAPGLVSPINNERAGSLRPTFTVNNSERNAAVGALHYDFHVALDQAFTQMITSGIVDEGGGQTRFTAPNDILYDRVHYWRVRAFDDETTGPWAATQTLRGPAAPVASPSPTPGGGGAPCTGSSPLSIIECERSKYGHMSSGQTVDFLRASARSLNAKGIPDGPFGILRKNGGSSCNGYSCDIICSGQGGGQRQWDVLQDAEGSQGPAWGGPHTLPNIRIDTCEIQ